MTLITRKSHTLKVNLSPPLSGPGTALMKDSKPCPLLCSKKWVLCLKVTLLDLLLSPCLVLDTSPGCCHLLVASSHLLEHCLLSFCPAYVRWGADPTLSHQATGAGPSNIVPVLLEAESTRRGGSDLPGSTDSRGGMPATRLVWCQEPCWDVSSSALLDLCRNGVTLLIFLTST